jgi:LCP family protein required for cell wall assembly
MQSSRRKPNKKQKSTPVSSVDPKEQAQFPAVGMTLSSYGHGKSQGIGGKPAEELKPKKKRITLKRVFLTLLALVILTCGYLGGKSLYELHKAFGGSIFGLFETKKLNGESSGHVNILLAGMAGSNSGQTGGPELTDSVMVVSLNVKNNSGWMLSIPRDLWTDIPGHGYNKINATYEDDGIGQLENIVSKDLNIPINYYSIIDYNAFKQAVDAVGGIRIDIQSSDPRGIYDAYTHLKLPNGWVNLNGNQALDLARARGDDSAGDVSYGVYSDFDREMHQRQMLEAIKTKATSGGVLANPIKLANLFSALGNNVKTDFSLSNVRRLYDLSKKIPDNKIKSLSLNNDNGKDLLTNYYSYYGGDALIPALGVGDYSAIQEFVAQQN